jgi:PPOX class probable F420-dependent enzyme
MAIPIPGDVRQLLDAPNYVHLSTLRADGSPRNWVVWVGLEDDHILVCTSDAVRKAKDMRRDPRVALSVTDMANPYRMAAIQGQVVDVRPDEGCATWTRSPSSTPTHHSPAAAPIAYVS